MLRVKIRRLLGRVCVPMVKRYLRQERDYTWQRIRLRVKPGVFHPGLFYSTHALLDYLKQEPLAGKSLLELGAGSGLISIFSARRKAEVTATDISAMAVENIAANALQNGVALRIIHSDLFENIPLKPFDYIVINPPYYRANPHEEADHAWYAGEELQYFQRLFAGLGNYIHRDSRVIMVLSEDCDLAGISRFAAQYGFRLLEKKRKMRMLEWTIIYEISPMSAKL